MKKANFVRGVAQACYIIFSILRVMAVIGAVSLLILTVSLSFMPKNSVVTDTATRMDVTLNLKGSYGEMLSESLAEEDGFTVTEDGVTMHGEESVTIDNRMMGLSLIPSLSQLLVSIFLFEAAKRAARALRDASFTPFSPELAANLKKCGILLFVLAGVPFAVSALVTVISLGKAQLQTEIDMMVVLWGFVLLAASELCDYAATLAPFPMGDFAPAGEPFAEEPKAAPSEEKKDSDETPPPPSDHGDFHPDAF
ncbi:MAG: hypothetical protein IKC69_06270 [Clostridia bacterium]|nr:hypothetical protein [Clostridia bacterium]